MPSIINADRGIVSGITGIVQTADGTGNLTLQANGVSVLTVDTSNSVTITGLVSATGNITGGNILTVGIMSSTGNAIYGNILTAGLFTATGNITGGNILTGGRVSATGNIQGSFILGNGSQLTGVTAGITTGKSLAITLIMGG